MNKKQHTELRSQLFRHLDGIAIAPTAHALHVSGVADQITRKGEVTLEELSQNANDGYMNVAMRLLASQGWLDYFISDDVIRIKVNHQSPLAFGLFHLYREVVELMQFSGHFHPRKFQKEPFSLLERIFENYKNNYGLTISGDPIETAIQHQILKHIEGMIVGPTTVALGMGGMFHKYFMEASFKPEEFHTDPESFERLLDIFVYLEWFEKENGNYSFTEKGLFFAKRASAYGVTVSYIPTFRRLQDLLFGDPSVLWNVPQNAPEIHVDREMNVWGSGGSHANYFNKIDDIIIDIFNMPIQDQPRGIVDMGCGNGAFLIHIFEVIENRTARGDMLDEYPLFLVGADLNEAALRVTKANLVNADIWAKVIPGDIGRPEVLEKDLWVNYKIRLHDLLNVRTFLDHNRIWRDPKITEELPESSSTGAFAFRGTRIPNSLVEENLREHLTQWAPYVKKFGLLVIELHTIPPSLVAKNLGRTPATAYDATHGYSDQYIVEVDVFHQVAARCGLFPDPNHFSKFPNSELSTVTINLLKER